ncbi:MAG: hypothetical protein Q8R20_02385 [Nanoarchaeota archaeon]|nr:hypothetical protein [Nanoarchaeota archaeon]
MEKSNNLEKFGKVWNASGVTNFFGDGYPFHIFLKPFGLDFRGSTFVAKTATLRPRAGNMPLRKNFMPKEWNPKCIWMNWLRGYALNSVGLSGPGAKALFEMGRWQKRKEPFVISFMSVEDAPEKRTEELHQFVALFREHLPHFQAQVALQINFSCPNVGLRPEEIAEEVTKELDITSVLKIPLIPKINLEIPVEIAKKISDHPACAGICITNTIPFGHMPDRIDWQKLFKTKSKTPGQEESPLYKRDPKFGGGGLSGKPLFPLLCEWIKNARSAGIEKPLNVGGGILSPKDVQKIAPLLRKGDSIFIGSVAFLRPWNTRGIIRQANRLL